MVAPKVMVVDDEPQIRWALAEELSAAGYRVRAAATGAAALAHLAEDGQVDLVLLDQRLPDMDGLALLERIKAHDHDAVVILLTAYSNVESAVDAMRSGAYHYATKPLELAAVRRLVERGLETTQLRRELRALRAAQAAPYALGSILGESPAIARSRALLARYAANDATVLITGESGTGKDLAAKVLHHNSPRAARPFMNITCTALPEALLESELFGHEKGAFTDARQARVGLLQAADGGTVFLDEIGDMPPALQAKLLRFLEDRTLRRVGGTADVRVDVRIVAATHVDLAEAVRSRTFREDLYYRLAVLELPLPALRDRPGDVPLLARAFMDTIGRDLHKPVHAVTDAAWRVLEGHHWPGNVRELRNVVERTMLLLDGGTVDAADVQMASSPTRPDSFTLPAAGIALHELERSLVLQAITRTGGNQTEAARLLGLHRDQVRYRLGKYGLLGGPRARPATRDGDDGGRLDRGDGSDDGDDRHLA